MPLLQKKERKTRVATITSPEPLLVKEDRGRTIEGESQTGLGGRRAVPAFGRTANRRMNRTSTLTASGGSQRFSPLAPRSYQIVPADGMGYLPIRRRRAWAPGYLSNHHRSRWSVGNNLVAGRKVGGRTWEYGVGMAQEVARLGLASTEEYAGMARTIQPTTRASNSGPLAPTLLPSRNAEPISGQNLIGGSPAVFRRPIRRGLRWLPTRHGPIRPDPRRCNRVPAQRRQAGIARQAG